MQLLSNGLTLRKDKSILYSRTSINLLTQMLNLIPSNLFIYSMKEEISLYGGLLINTCVNKCLENIIYLITILVLFLTGFFPNILEEKYKNKIIKKITGEQYKITEYALILLFIISGTTLLINSYDIVSIFLSIELQSYGLYLLSTLYKNSESSTSGGLTYFLLGGLSSCFILLGTTLLYANSGSTSLEGLYVVNNLIKFSEYNNYINSDVNYIDYGITLMVIGFLFKVSAAPFHFWSPDVYDAIPTIVTTFVAIIPKISIFLFLMQIVHYTSVLSFDINKLDWRYVLLLSTLISWIIGTVLGLNQFRIKRLYAYSTIGHVGFILLALSINTVESIQSFIFYLIQYSLSNLNAFIILIVIGITLYNYEIQNAKVYTEKINSPIQLVEQLKSYFGINPLIAISLSITIYSFMGIPPLLGFFAKQMVISAALDRGLALLVIIAILTSVISAVYYLSVIKQIFFYGLNINNKLELDYIIKPYNALLITVSILTLFISLFIINPKTIIRLSHILTIITFKT
jgi:NADH-ubiquinone oxidoreductase chain 2